MENRDIKELKDILNKIRISNDEINKHILIQLSQLKLIHLDIKELNRDIIELNKDIAERHKRARRRR